MNASRYLQLQILAQLKRAATTLLTNVIAPVKAMGKQTSKTAMKLCHVYVNVLLANQQHVQYQMYNKAFEVVPGLRPSTGRKNAAHSYAA